jgi:hypothetical protein
MFLMHMMARGVPSKIQSNDSHVCLSSLSSEGLHKFNSLTDTVLTWLTRVISLTELFFSSFDLSATAPWPWQQYFFSGSHKDHSHSRVVTDWQPLLVHITESTLEHQILHGLEGRLCIHDVRLDKVEHLDGGRLGFRDDHVF